MKNKPLVVLTGRLGAMSRSASMAGTMVMKMPRNRIATSRSGP